MKRALILLAVCLRADVGVLVPAGKTGPDPAVLALAETRVQVVIENGHATVKLRQIFENKTNQVSEGEYRFTLPAGASVADFAVWDGVVRIPGVVLPRREAEEAYERVRAMAIDPGLLSAGENEEERTASFSARVVPIPAFGRKRIEIEYRQRLAVENLETAFSIPLRPSAFQAQSTGLLEIEVEVRERAARNVQVTSQAYAASVAAAEGQTRVTFRGERVALGEDFALRYGVEPGLAVLGFREGSEPGFFEARWVAAAAPASNGAAAAESRTLTVLFDGSLSNQWEKLQRNYLALETALRSLRGQDRFQVLLFHREVVAWSGGPAAATSESVTAALEWLKKQRLRAGSDLDAGLQAAAKVPGENRLVLALTDGQANTGVLRAGEILRRYRGAAQGIRTYVLAVGDDANEPLLRQLAGADGLFEAVRSSEPLEFKLNALVGKLGRKALPGQELAVGAGVKPDQVYRLDGPVFAGSAVSWAGRYGVPGTAAVSVGGVTVQGQFPGEGGEARHLPRLWAEARVNALMEKMARDGEDKASIEEVIRLGRRYKLVTPYTSFLAAPRSLLRPRMIRPGDPVIRVRTDAAIRSVVAVLPFGEVKALRYLAGEDIWQTRFLAPADLADGTYWVRLILRDRTGRQFEEKKSFVVISKVPVVKVATDKQRYRRGEAVLLRASAPATARSVVARMAGLGPVFLHWNGEAKTNTGVMRVPEGMPAGRYRIEVTAEDFAHNVGRQEVAIEVVP